MYDVQALKGQIEITETTVECPVIGCNQKIERQRKRFKREDRFMCPNHDIYISPSTFGYKNETDNMLWIDDNDMALFNQIKKFKRESRISQDNSEDAVSWNVFRYIERNNLTTAFLQDVLGIDETSPEIIYWSYSRSDGGVWNPLRKGREQFELRPAKGSEPDLFILGDKSMVIIEAKFGASNRTEPSNPKVKYKYVSGGQNWWNEVIHSDFKTLAVQDKRYELARFWLIGSWMAKQYGLDFYLINLTLSNQENVIEQSFKEHIIEDGTRKFKRITWEDIYLFIKDQPADEKEKEIILNYYQNKSQGYDAKGNLQKAFLIPTYQ